MSDSDERIWDQLQFPFGAADATDKIGSTAAPLLAGFAFALIGLTIDKGNVMGEADLALLLLVFAGVALVSSVQLNFNARRYHFSVEEYFDLCRLAEDQKEEVSVSEVKKMAREYLGEERIWAERSRVAYNLGVAVFFFGVAATLIPVSGIWHLEPLRAAAVILVTAAGLVEATLIAGEAVRLLLDAVLRRENEQARPPASGRA